MKKELLAPNGKPSKLTAEQYELVRTPAFKKWFGDWENNPENSSKVIDEETKEPLVVYHGYLVGGGAGRKFYEFKNLPAFFSKTKQFAYDYASTKSMDAGIDADIDTYACFLNIRKLFDSKNKENIKLAEEQLPEKIRVSHGTAWFLSADIPKEEVIEQMIGIITIPTDDLLVKDILSSNVGDIIAEKVSASQYENKILLYKDEDWGYITDARYFDEVVENEVAEFIYKENTKPFETGITYRGKRLKKFTFNEETYSYELNKDPLFLEYINEVEKRKKYYIDNILKFLKKTGLTIEVVDRAGYKKFIYVSRINLKKYKTTTKNNWTMFENETLQKFLIDNNFGGWSALERGDKTYGVYNNKNIKLADGTNTTFDSDNPDIRFNKGGELELDVEKVEKIKSLILKNFPYLESLYLIGKGLNGYAFVTEINNEVYVVKYSTSITEYWLTKMASVSNPPNVVKFEEVKEISDNFEYIIIHKWLNRDAMPNKNAWEVALGNDFKGYREGIKFIDKKELEYVMKLSKKLNKSLEDYFGFTIDTNQDNWGYDENNKLLLFDLDGNVSKSQYEVWMNKHSNSIFEKGGELNIGIFAQIWGWFGIKF